MYQNMKKKNVAVIFGGCSPEYEVSLASASAVIEHIDPDCFRPVLIGITRQGDWLYYQGEINRIEKNTWQDADCFPACLSPDRSRHELFVFREKEMERIPIDLVFPVLHGQNGEDGTVQGLCELAGIPLAGCGTLASALCMDKDRAHKLVSLAGIRVPASAQILPGFRLEQVEALAEKIGYPLFVKPVRAGSSYGIAKLDTKDRLQTAVKTAFQFDDCVLLEEAIPGFEVGCAILGNRSLTAGEPDEIELEDGFFDFTEKYNLITSKIHVPARISPEKAAEIKNTAKKIYRTLGCSGFARVDLFLQPDGALVFNEVNTIPGFTAHSRYPGMIKAAGISFEELIRKILSLAEENN